jgi:hypothetical protein
VKLFEHLAELGRDLEELGDLPVKEGLSRGNVVLSPANWLAVKGQWQRVANSLPHGDVLVAL